MRKLLLLGLVGCWTSSSTPARKPAPEPAAASGGGQTYGGVQYGGLVSILGTSDSSDSGGFGSGGVGLGGGGAGAGGGVGVGRIGSGGALGSGVGGVVGGSAGGAPTVQPGDPSGQTSALDPAIIRRYVRRNLPKIQLCYEKELTRNPSLAGKVMVHFAISGEGNVTQSSGSGMPPVDSCVAQEISQITFPKPQGGGVVVVNYPFVFQSTQDTPTP
jgi:hypothetical protein